jgi:hypothetical protein
MKKRIFYLAVFCLALTIITCNTATGGPGNGPGENINGGVDYLFVLGNSDNYPGAEVDLPAEWNLSDISGYASVTVKATLYSDEEGTTPAVKTNASDNLAQFKLLKATGGWDDSGNICGPTKYNMVLDGDTVWTVTNDASGVPTKLLLQANWAEFPNAVKSIHVHEITFTAKTGAPVLDKVYDNGTYMTVEGNKITFDNAEYSHAAAIYVFPDTFPETLTGKDLVIAFTIDSHTHVPSGSSIEHQIHIQAANSDKERFNGRNDQPGQKYFTLDDTATTGWAENSGTVRIPLNDLLAAANVTADANDCKGPFTLDAIRICNNGTVWEGHTRCKSYPLIITSVTVE